MKIRKITSLTAALSFILIVMTSIILYIVPQGRVAYWADWHLWGLTKTDWGNLHINLGFLFLISLFLHIYYNWKALTSYLKNKARQMKVWTPDMNMALAITVIFAIGTYLMVPPFSWMMSLNNYFKDTGAAKYGEPPYGHAELSSLETFAKKMDLDLVRSMALLQSAGYPVENGAVTLKTIARQYQKSPQQIYEVIKPTVVASKSASQDKGGLPGSPPPGTGNMTLAGFCAQYDLNLKWILRELKQVGLLASGESTLKQIATENKTGPIDIYEAIVGIVKNKALKTDGLG